MRLEGGHEASTDARSREAAVGASRGRERKGKQQQKWRKRMKQDWAWLDQDMHWTNKEEIKLQILLFLYRNKPFRKIRNISVGVVMHADAFSLSFFFFLSRLHACLESNMHRAWRAGCLHVLADCWEVRWLKSTSILISSLFLMPWKHVLASISSKFRHVSRSFCVGNFKQVSWGVSHVSKVSSKFRPGFASFNSLKHN